MGSIKLLYFLNRTFNTTFPFKKPFLNIVGLQHFTSNEQLDDVFETVSARNFISNFFLIMQWFRKEKVMPLSMLNVFGNRKDSIVDVQEEQLHTDAERIRRRKARHGMEKGRNVSWYWIEKLKLLVDAFQIYGLCWMMSQAWPWPTSWLRRSRFLLLFNLDIFSLTPRGASLGHGSARYSIWGEMEGYWIYATVWASLPWIATFFYILKCLLWKRHTEEYYLSHREALRFRLFYLFQILYLPIAIAVGRLWNCNADGTLSVDPVMICWGSEHRFDLVLLKRGRNN